MTQFTFRAESEPFPRWWGPFSPARGNYSGFRFHQHRLGTWVESDFGREFWAIADSVGSKLLSRLVLNHWSGGRVVLLPSGMVIKPLQKDYEVGQRCLIGRFSGAVALKRPNNNLFDLSSPGNLAPGSDWLGPKTTGLECAIQPDGSLECTWSHPAGFGRESVRAQVAGPDRMLATGFRRARPGDESGRVRITANGHIITNRQCPGGAWQTLYLGCIPSGSFPHQNDWIE